MSLVAQLPKRVINALHQLIDTTGRPELPVLVHERVDFFLEPLLVGRWLLRESQRGRRCGYQHQSSEHAKTWSHVTLLHQSTGHHFARRSARSDHSERDLSVDLNISRIHDLRTPFQPSRLEPQRRAPTGRQFSSSFPPFPPRSSAVDRRRVQGNDNATSSAGVRLALTAGVSTPRSLRRSSCHTPQTLDQPIRVGRQTTRRPGEGQRFRHRQRSLARHRRQETGRILAYVPQLERPAGRVSGRSTKERPPVLQYVLHVYHAPIFRRSATSP